MHARTNSLTVIFNRNKQTSRDYVGSAVLAGSSASGERLVPGTKYVVAWKAIYRRKRSGGFGLGAKGLGLYPRTSGEYNEAEEHKLDPNHPKVRLLALPLAC